MIADFESLYDMLEAYPDEQSCIEKLTTIKWSNGEYCPHCGSNKLYHFLDKRTHKCSSCRKRFSIKVGTIFEDSKIPLRKWFVAIYMVTPHKKGIASTQLAKDIKVTQKTAWFMLQRLRFASQTRSFNNPLSGNIEIDETYIGGKEKNKHTRNRLKGTQGRSTKTKTAVLGIVERKGELRTFTLSETTGQTIKNYALTHIKMGSRVLTDEFRGYKTLKPYFNHHTVNHSVGEYVVLDRHTNTIEGVWSLFKRGVIGIYHHVSKKHLHYYLNEFTYRYNSRELNDGECVIDLLSKSNGRLTYQELIA